ncbi:MAG: hypothetical protein MJY41_01070 [Bacteroidales bacterium]|nr:hypothetical protein [Bacteroidales bacterium]
MKKILIALALIASVQFAGAQEQVKSVSAAKSALEAAQAAAQNPKKNTKMQTWLKLGQSYIDAYNAPMGNAWVGVSKSELQLIGGNEKPSAVEEVLIGGQPMTKEVYETRNYYFTPNGVLTLIETTKPICADPLDKALEAFVKAFEMDANAQKTSDIIAGIKSVATKYTEEAYNSYYFGNLAEASQKFEKAAAASATRPLGQIDTMSVYNIGFTAWQAGDLARAKKYLEQCLAYNYEGAEGDVYAKLADISDRTGDKEAQVANLEKGFSKYPQSQVILVGLINYYLTSGESTDRLFELLDAAKKNEPNNPSLFYVEGNIHEKLGNHDAAAESYKQCAVINPDYEYGYIGLGVLYYNLAVEIQEAAQNEFDDAKYMVLVEKFESTLKSCVEPFEKAFEITSDNAVKVSVAEYLKNACFRFREDAEYSGKYETYNKFVADNQ